MRSIPVTSKTRGYIMPPEGFSWQKLGADLRERTTKISTPLRDSLVWRDVGTVAREWWSWLSKTFTGLRESPVWHDLSKGAREWLSENLDALRRSPIWRNLSAKVIEWLARIFATLRTSTFWRKLGARMRGWLSGNASARREGSPWRGLGTVFLKEMSDNLSSARMRVLELLVVLFGAVVVYFAAEQIRQTIAEDRFLFLRLFAPPTTAGETSLTFTLVLNILVPLVAIGLGFDAINGEYNRRTLSRILAQPIYRDALLLGKFLAGLATLSISLITLWLLVIGFGLLRLGIPPSAEELGRSVVFLVITVAYAGVWLALAMLFSILFRSPATAALVGLGVWLFLALLWPALAQPLGEAISPPDVRFTMLGLPTPDTELWKVALARFSPSQLYGEAVVAILNPDEKSLANLLAQFQGRIMGAPLPLGQSIVMAWPQIVGLIAGMILLYVVGYVAFQRQEVRA